MDKTNEEMLGLLRDIKRLLIPISDQYRAAYEERKAVREVIAAVVNTAERETMYQLMNGARTQADIAQRAGVSQPAVSRFISTAVDNDLVEMVRVGAAERPARKYDIRAGTKLRGEG